MIIINKLSCHNDGRVNSPTVALCAWSGSGHFNRRKFCHEEGRTWGNGSNYSRDKLPEK
jgi:hypothetical protein